MPTHSTKAPRGPKRIAIIDAAADLFVLHGYDGTNIEMIAEKAGVSRQTIYNQYASKGSLFLAITADLVWEIMAPLTDFEHSANMRETLLALGRRLCKAMLTPRAIALRRLVITEAARFPELGHAAYEASIAVIETRVASYLLEQRRLLISDSVLAARQFLALVVHPIEIRTQFIGGAGAEDDEISQHLEAAVDTFLRAFGAGPDQSARRRELTDAL